MSSANIDPATVAGFGDEWTRFQYAEDSAELQSIFDDYFSIFPWDRVGPTAVGFDVGCGTGRWARIAATRVAKLHCVDASEQALDVARRNLADRPQCVLHRASVDALPFPSRSMDFGYSLGVLHHVPDTQSALRNCVDKLKPGAPFLLYLYYALENRPAWVRATWRASNALRWGISRLPRSLRYASSQVIAGSIYWPAARAAQIFDRLGVDVANWPLAAYRERSFYVMRTDALDRFGTQLEQRFTRNEIERLMRAAGLQRITFREGAPYWCALGYRDA